MDSGDGLRLTLICSAAAARARSIPVRPPTSSPALSGAGRACRRSAAHRPPGSCTATWAGAWRGFPGLQAIMLCSVLRPAWPGLCAAAAGHLASSARGTGAGAVPAAPGTPMGAPCRALGASVRQAYSACVVLLLPSTPHEKQSLGRRVGGRRSDVHSAVCPAGDVQRPTAPPAQAWSACNLVAAAAI